MPTSRSSTLRRRLHAPTASRSRPATWPSQTRLLKPEDLRSAGIAPTTDTPNCRRGSPTSTAGSWARIEIEVTNRVVASQTSESVVIASQTDLAFDKPGPERQRMAADRPGRRREGRRRAQAVPWRNQLHQDQPPGVQAGSPPGRNPLRLRRAPRLVPGCADLAIEVQRDRPGPDPQPAPRDGTSTKNLTNSLLRYVKEQGTTDQIEKFN